MPVIRQLPPSVVNKIAAGEVIERPASVVKELLENSLDAGATRVDVAVEQGGTELIRIVDNGCGIAAEQLPLAVASHATSKLVDADDLFRVATLGFRGEALASIAEVSRLTLRSRPAAQSAAAELIVDGGRLGAVEPAAGAEGTTIEVRRLFFNTPVRRKFLKTTSTEFSHVSEAFTRLALAHPQVHFTLRHNDRLAYDLPPVGNWLDRIRTLFGGELANHMLWVESADEEIRLSGYVAHPSQSRSHTKMQYLFLNGRHIRDRALQHALGEAYRGLLTVGRQPICCLSLQMPADLVDVNVHPTKLEVRFRDGGRHYSQLLGTLRTRFLTSDLSHPMGGGVFGKGPATEDQHADPTTSSGGAAADRQEAVKQELKQWVQTQLNQWTAHPADSEPERSQATPGPTDVLGGQDPFAQPAAGGQPQPPTQDSAEPASLPPVPQTAEAAAAVHRVTTPEGPRSALQVANRYLVTGEGDSVVIIDQHALHERVLYEQLRTRVLGGQLEVQRLLVPEPVELSAEEALVVEEQADLFAQLGVGVEPFGQNTVLVSSYPAMLRHLNPQELLQELLGQLLAGGKRPQRRDVIDSVLHSLACKAAVKAGDRLSEEEIAALLEQRHLAQDAHHCPHGRPTALVLTREQLDRQFKRT